MRVLTIVAVVAVLALVAVSAADADVEADKPKAKGKRQARVGMVYPRVDHSLLRSSPNVVIVPKGDPRARAPARAFAARSAAAVVPTLTQAKAPRQPKKPTTPTAPTTPTSPTGAPGVNVGAAAPLKLKAAAPTYSSAQCTAQKGSCTSSCANGNIVHGICPGPASIACCVPKTATPTAPTSGSNCLANFNPSTLAARAEAYQQAYRAHGVVYSQSSRQFGAAPPVAYADCSSFVTSILDSLGWDCLFASGRYTAAMIPIMRSRGGFHSTPKTGDIVMWTSHTGVVVQACAGGQVRMVAMGSHGAADTGCIALSSLPSWGSGTFLGFWTPN